MPYISVNRATRNAVNAPIARQSRPVRGWKKLAANTANSAVLMITRGHSPYPESASTSTPWAAPGCAVEDLQAPGVLLFVDLAAGEAFGQNPLRRGGFRGRAAPRRAAAGVADQRDDAGDDQAPEQQGAHGHQHHAPGAHAVAPVHHRGLLRGLSPVSGVLVVVFGGPVRSAVALVPAVHTVRHEDHHEWAGQHERCDEQRLGRHAERDEADNSDRQGDGVQAPWLAFHHVSLPSRDISYRACRYGGGVRANVTPDRVQRPYPVGVYRGRAVAGPREGERHGCR